MSYDHRMNPMYEHSSCMIFVFFMYDQRWSWPLSWSLVLRSLTVTDYLKGLRVFIEWSWFCHLGAGQVSSSTQSNASKVKSHLGFSFRMLSRQFVFVFLMVFWLAIWSCNISSSLWSDVPRVKRGHDCYMLEPSCTAIKDTIWQVTLWLSKATTSAPPLTCPGWLLSSLTSSLTSSPGLTS